MTPPTAPESLPVDRSALRIVSLGWALMAAAAAGALGLLPFPGAGPHGADPGEVVSRLEAALRSAGCGFFYGLLAFHLQRVDPDDGHLQAGLVGAVCGLRSLGAPFDAGPLDALATAPLTGFLPAAMMEAIRGWLPLWLPLIGSSLLLKGAQRRLPVLRP